MRCSKCGADNRQGRKFCAECGAPLAATCAKCGAVNEPNEKFCGECGAALTEAARRSASEDTPISVSGGGERRHLTVLFCDLVGSTEIAAQLDPEEWRELVASYLRATAEAITRYGGHVAKYLGDGAALIRRGLAGMRQAGSKVAISTSLTWLAEAQALRGKIDDCLGFN